MDINNLEQKKKISRAERKELLKNKPEIIPGLKSTMLKFPVFLAVPVVYVIMGMVLKLWHPAWLIFFFIPIYYQLAFAFGSKTKRGFLLNLPVIPVAVSAFLTLGTLFGLWGVAWIIFLFIPVYYWMAAMSKDEF